MVSLPREVVARTAAAVDGGGTVRFTGWAPVSADRCRLWEETVAFVHGLLAAER
ncbi:hypothetical protein AB0442_36875 [Kitasatospora sp. NPDC085895]|uniref:hypothetical protein n=1 Tax=Kitasatospora sp. NPDC085895 TaxID=3155057 RepID=UPI00345062A6